MADRPVELDAVHAHHRLVARTDAEPEAAAARRARRSRPAAPSRSGCRGHVGTTAIAELDRAPSHRPASASAMNGSKPKRTRATCRRSPAPRSAPRGRAPRRGRASRGTAARASFDVGGAERTGEVAAVEHELRAVTERRLVGQAGTPTIAATSSTRPDAPGRDDTRHRLDRVGARGQPAAQHRRVDRTRDGSS